VTLHLGQPAVPPMLCVSQMRFLMVWWLLVVWSLGFSTNVLAQEISRTVVLNSPLTTVVRVTEPVQGPLSAVTASITVPADAPADLGVGVFVVDQHGRWFQGLLAGTLTPGTHQIVLPVIGSETLISQNERGAWNAANAAQVRGAGLFFWSASASRAAMTVTDLRAVALESAAMAPTAPALMAVRTSGTAVSTGERWTFDACPTPFPSNPFHAAEFSLDAVITTPDGKTQSIPGFYNQPMAQRDRGDRDEVMSATAGKFSLRFRPQQPGQHHIQVTARWGQHRISYDLPPLNVTGSAWDGYVRVDKNDPRFFSVAGEFWWPIGPNLRSVYDLRGSEHLHTILTPDRGLFAYDAYLRRLAAHHVTAVEVWLSSWNFALEWRASWPGFYGQGRYNMINAWRLDELLDLAYRLGIRVNLVLHNHGQASTNSDAEWDNNPYNLAVGGTLNQAAELFTHPDALAGQAQLRRYLVARYADHPAIMGWKLWSEVNLTAGRGSTLRTWHEQASAAWKALDTYGHPITTHWCSDYNLVDREIAAQPGIDYLCIDAYHGNARLLADVLWSSTMDPVPRRGLMQFNKPVLTTEYGGNWDACPKPKLLAEHASGPWAALVSGHAGSPMLWWFEWLDQGNYFAPYPAISRFIAGEDLRGSASRSIVLNAVSAHGNLWLRGWSRPGRLLGYLQDSEWGRQGGVGVTHSDARVEIGSNIAAGNMDIEWWDPNTGERLQTIKVQHPGGPLALQPPAFSQHLAFKLTRRNDG
jgi:hypothetical protein